MTLTRRNVLIGGTGLVLGLPYLEYFATTAKAADVDRPKRFVALSNPQGYCCYEWFLPQGPQGESFALRKTVEPLAPWTSSLIPIWGIDNYTADLGTIQGGHTGPIKTLFTGNVFSRHVDDKGQLLARSAQSELGDGALSYGPSIDQVLASRMGQGYPYSSINLAIGGRAGVASKQFFRGKDDPVSPIGDPRVAFKDLFVSTVQADEQFERLRLRRASVLDGVLHQFHSLDGRLGYEDRQRLESHAQKLRAIERRLESGPRCAPPTSELPEDYDPQYSDWITSPAMIDVAVLALSCGMAPVLTLAFGNSDRAFQLPFDWLRCTGFEGEDRPVVPDNLGRWHDLVHTGYRRRLPGGGSESFAVDPGLIRGFRWYAEQVARLLEGLSGVDDGEGKTLLETTLVMWASHFNGTGGHTPTALPVVLAGNVGSSRGSGRMVALGNWREWAAEIPKSYPYNAAKTIKKETRRPNSLNQLYVSILQGFGYGDTTFGWTGNDVPQGPLPGLL